MLIYDTSTDYAGPGPASGSGSHRYVAHPFIGAIKLPTNAKLKDVTSFFSIDT